MLIDEQFRKCATDLWADIPHPDTGALVRTPAASAFFVGVPLEGVEGVMRVYAVTARHVLDESRKYGSLYIRINKPNTGYDQYTARQDDWTVNPDTDVAVIKAGLPLDGYDHRVLPVSMLLTQERAAQLGVGAGDEVFFVGMFSLQPGRERAQPIIRFGTISMMPLEKIRVGAPIMADIDAYLVEARSWGGHSGSPAFVYFPPDRHLGSIMVGGSEILLLGLVHGHYEIPQDVAFIGDILGSGRVPINAGMALVIPAQAIIDTLMDPDLVHERAEAAELYKKGSHPRSDG